MANKIQLGGQHVLVEHDAGASGIYPGMLCKINSSNDAVVHATAGGFGEVMIACEDIFNGKNVDTALTSGELCQFVIPAPGATFYGLLKASETVVVGSQVCSGAGGLFVNAANVDSAVDVKQIMAVCLEAQSAPSSNTLTKMRRV